MYRDLREVYWWSGLKREITDIVGKCLTCKQVKAKHQLPFGLLQPVKILMWKWERTELDEHRALGSELVANTKDKMRVIWDRQKAALDRQKSYADLKHKDIEYTVGDFVFLKVSSWKKIHDEFHVSMLRCYRSDPMHVVSVEDIEIRPDLTFEEEPVQILDREWYVACFSAKGLEFKSSCTQESSFLQMAVWEAGWRWDSNGWMAKELLREFESVK
ncbi:uncharacterized protein LOC108478031 [Gossypium arboreum]|uniref:uncharacterized protein LOC108478031 n=1 Tax=Gossypium arboreum TaxID=29729 RepID=UPI0022F16898|nr:uncharacterized protein LOC108478031 [Gossypium arboreum]